MSDRLINVDAVFTYLDEMEANLGDIHCDITKDVLIRSQARDAHIQYWITGLILSEYLKSIGMWE